MGKFAITIMIAVAVVCLAAPAQACSECSTPVELASCCSKHIINNSRVLKHHMQCDFPAHRCAHPWFPDCEVCIPAPCHEAPQICNVDREICIEPPCHMPAITLRLVECCLCGIELTGTKDLIVICEGCKSHD